MIKLKQKHIDNMLRQTFREEAEKIVLPSSDKLWAELQSRLDPHVIPELEEKAGFLLAKEAAAEKKYDAYSFWKKHKYLAGIAAACFLTIVISASLVPFSGMKYFLTDMGKGLGSNRVGQADFMESDDQIVGLALECTEEGTDSFPPPSDTLREPSIKGSEKGAIQSESIPFDSGETILFTDLETFVSSLSKIKILSPDEIWQIKTTPAGFRFINGGITKTESYLVNVFQEYEGPEGQSLTLLQEFFHDEGVFDTGIITTDGLTNPLQVGSYSGHLLSKPYGSLVVIWMQDNSRVTLSGQLGEEELFEVLNALEK
jgi:hypothetical protein